MKKSLTNIYVTHNAKDKTYDEFYNALGTDFIWGPTGVVYLKMYKSEES